MMAEQSKPVDEQLSFLGTDPVGKITIKAEYRVNKKTASVNPHADGILEAVRP